MTPEQFYAQYLVLRATIRALLEEETARDAVKGALGTGDRVVAAPQEMTKDEVAAKVEIQVRGRSTRGAGGGWGKGFGRAC